MESLLLHQQEQTLPILESTWSMSLVINEDLRFTRKEYGNDRVSDEHEKRQLNEVM